MRGSGGMRTKPCAEIGYPARMALVVGFGKGPDERSVVLEKSSLEVGQMDLRRQ